MISLDSYHAYHPRRGSPGFTTVCPALIQVSTTEIPEESLYENRVNFSISIDREDGSSYNKL